MDCLDYENLRLVDIACECHNESVQKSKYISNNRCSTDETYDVESIYYKRGGLVVCNDSSGRICVEYKKKTDDSDDGVDDKSQDRSNKSLEEKQNDIPEKIESCFPYKIIKRKGGQCSAALYPYEIIRKFPFDDICKCNENKIVTEEVKPEESPESPTTNKPTENGKNKKSSSLKSALSTDRASKSSLKKLIPKRFTKRIMNLSKDKLISSVTSDDLCNCFPDLNCQCPKTGEYKVLKNEYEVLRDRPIKTKYLAKPCMQTFFNRCQVEDGVQATALDDATKENDEHQTVFLDSGTKCFYNNTPCCPCPKRDPDPDHPRYLSTKVNVTDLMKQLLTFHFNRSYMSQYYSRVQMDNSDEPCEICQEKIMQAAGCVGSCCKCPKPIELKSCNCPQSSESESENISEDDQDRTEQLEQNISPMLKQNQQEKFENKNVDFDQKCGLLLQKLAKQTSGPTSQNKCDCSNINYKTDYQCYNVMCTNTPGYNEINVCSKCNFWNEKNFRSHNEQEIQERTHWDKQKRKITRTDEPVTEELDTRSDYEADPFRKRNMFKGFFSKMKLDWPKKKHTLRSTEHKDN